MRINRDAWILIFIIIAMGISTYWVSSKAAYNIDSPSSYSTSPRGTKALYLLLEGLNFKVGRHNKPFDQIPENAKVMFLIDPQVLPKKEKNDLKRWVSKGNTLIISISNKGVRNGVEDFRLSLYNYYSSAPTLVKPRPGRYSTGVKHINVYDYTYPRPVKGMDVILKDKGHIIATEIPVGKGHIIFVGDPMIFSNERMKMADNVVLVTNFVYENVGRNDRVLFSEYTPRAIDQPPPMLGVGGKLAMVNLAFVVLLVLISSGRRFGQVHPLPESTERRRGWELIKAMAGLYQRAQAKEYALATIYNSFRRELVVKFGVLPYATPTAVVETVARFVKVDKSKLESVIKGCERVAGGYSISEGEAMVLIGSIEELRRELGIVRSTKQSGRNH